MNTINVASHILPKIEDVVLEVVKPAPYKNGNTPSRGTVGVVVAMSKLKFRLLLRERGITDQRTIWDEKSLKAMDKNRLLSKDVRTMGYKHTFYPSREVARQVWLECNSFEQFCERCGFDESSAMPIAWDKDFAGVHKRSPLLNGKPGKRNKVPNLLRGLFAKN